MTYSASRGSLGAFLTSFPKQFFFEIFEDLAIPNSYIFKTDSLPVDE